MSALQRLKDSVSGPVKSAITALTFAALTAVSMAPAPVQAASGENMAWGAGAGAVVGNVLGAFTNAKNGRTIGAAVGAVSGAVLGNLFTQEPAPVVEVGVPANNLRQMSDKEHRLVDTKMVKAFSSLSRLDSLISQHEMISQLKSMAPTPAKAAEFNALLSGKNGLDKQLLDAGVMFELSKNDFIQTVTTLERSHKVNCGKYATDDVVRLNEVDITKPETVREVLAEHTGEKQTFKRTAMRF